MRVFAAVVALLRYWQKKKSIAKKELDYPWCREHLLAKTRVGLLPCVAAGSAAPGDVHMVPTTTTNHHHHLGVLPQAKQSLATLTKDVPKRHSLAMPGETVLNGNQEWVMQADLPLTAAIRQSQQTLYHSHPQHSADRQGEPPCAGQGAGPNPFWGAALFPHRGEKNRPNTPRRVFLEVYRRLCMGSGLPA